MRGESEREVIVAEDFRSEEPRDSLDTSSGLATRFRHVVPQLDQGFLKALPRRRFGVGFAAFGR